MRCLGSSSVNTFGPGVDLQPCLGHVCVFQVVQWHPDQVAFDLIKIFADIFGWHELIKNVTCLDPFRRQKGIIVIESFD
jgi:hypothetical protein